MRDQDICEMEVAAILREFDLQKPEDATERETNLACELQATRAALRGLMTNPHINLGDLVYDVREREGKGWDGPDVKAWSDGYAIFRHHADGQIRADRGWRICHLAKRRLI